MAAFFTAASTQYLVNPTTAGLPTTGYPFSVGMWVNLTAAGTVNRMLWAISDTATTNNYLGLRMDTAESLSVVARAGGTEATGTGVSAIVASTFVFVVARFIGAASRRLSYILATGTIGAGNNTTSRAPTGLDTVTIGALSTSGGITEPWDGAISEYWLSNIDIGIDGGAVGATPPDLVRQLAYGGPFSVPHVAASIMEYRSFRKSLVSNSDDFDEIFHSIGGRQVWTNTNGVTLSKHPPLPYWYVKPGQTQRPLVI